MVEQNEGSRGVRVAMASIQLTLVLYYTQFQLSSYYGVNAADFGLVLYAILASNSSVYSPDIASYVWRMARRFLLFANQPGTGDRGGQRQWPSCSGEKKLGRWAIRVRKNNSAAELFGREGQLGRCRGAVHCFATRVRRCYQPLNTETWCQRLDHDISLKAEHEDRLCT